MCNGMDTCNFDGELGIISFTTLSVKFAYFHDSLVFEHNCTQLIFIFILLILL